MSKAAMSQTPKAIYCRARYARLKAEGKHPSRRSPPSDFDGIRRPSWPIAQTCIACRISKPATTIFFTHHQGVALSKICKVCAAQVRRKKYPLNRAKQHAWRLAHADHIKTYNRTAHYRKTYRITVAEYDVLYAEQQGLCAICKKVPHGNLPNQQVLHVDHDQCLRAGARPFVLAMQCGRGAFAG